ncbi:MAG: hypothetical protein Q8S84_03065 [bacterium]|nr:hypothetical protein [bacterium]MDP3380512.1 hypothetical protein [bacterium]
MYSGTLISGYPQGASLHFSSLCRGFPCGSLVSIATTQIYAFGTKVSSTSISLKNTLDFTSIYSLLITHCFSTVHSIFHLLNGNLTNTLAFSHKR